MLNIADASKVLHLSRSHLRRLVVTGELPSEDIDGEVMLDENVVAELGILLEKNSNDLQERFSNSEKNRQAAIEAIAKSL